jgi:TatD DNase family protein
LETDAPYLAPQSRRGQPNEPAFITETAACLAQIKNLSLEKVIRITSENAARFFEF